MAFPQRTWLATALFVLASTLVWWKLIGWSVAGKQLLPTLLLTPLTWWFVVGRHAKPRLWRGIVGGALTGFATQSAQDIPKVWTLFAQRGTADGEAQAIAIASVVIYLLIGFWSTVLGALVGFIAVGVQRSIDGEIKISW